MNEPSPIAREAAETIQTELMELGAHGGCVPRDPIASTIQSAIDRALKDYRQYHLTESCKQTKEILDLRAEIERLKTLAVADAGHGVGPSGESANLPAREASVSKAGAPPLSQTAINAAKELAMDSSHIPLIAAIIERHLEDNR